MRQNINGCWECKDFPCGRDMYGADHDIRLRAFARFIREEGAERLIELIIENEKKGIKYGYQKDYDFMNSEDEVLALLRTGKNHHHKENIESRFHD